MDKRVQGGTVSNNAPVGSAGNPASTDASSKMPFGKRNENPRAKNRSSAIERRIANMNKKGGK